MQFPEKLFMNLRELAAWLGIDPKTVRRKVSEGKLPRGKPLTASGQPVWSRDSAAVAAWMLANQELFEIDVKTAFCGKVRESAGKRGNPQEPEKQ